VCRINQKNMGDLYYPLQVYYMKSFCLGQYISYAHGFYTFPPLYSILQQFTKCLKNKTHCTKVSATHHSLRFERFVLVALRTHAHSHTHTFTHTQTHKHTHIHTHKDTHTHTHTHTHILCMYTERHTLHTRAH